jgi:hypothetical protein
MKRACSTFDKLREAVQPQLSTSKPISLDVERWKLNVERSAPILDEDSVILAPDLKPSAGPGHPGAAARTCMTGRVCVTGQHRHMPTRS